MWQLEKLDLIAIPCGRYGGGGGGGSDLNFQWTLSGHFGICRRPLKVILFERWLLMRGFGEI